MFVSAINAVSICVAMPSMDSAAVDLSGQAKLDVCWTSQIHRFLRKPLISRTPPEL